MKRVRLAFPDRVLFSVEARVRIDDLNYGAHLAHDRLVSMLHDVRAQFFRHLGYEEWSTEGRPMMVLDLAVSYRAQAFFDQVLLVEVAAGEVGSRVCELLYRMSERSSGTVVALARTGIGFFDGERQRLAMVPEGFREALNGAAVRQPAD
jgi:acyl-CoA thioesterase FadM